MFLWSKLKQLSNLNDMKLEFGSICNTEAKGLFEIHFRIKDWSCDPILLSHC